MTPIEEILKISQNLEQILQNQYGATGRGLREKVDSVAEQLPEETVRKISKLASMRNKATHENVALAKEKIDAFRKIAGDVLVSLMLYRPFEAAQTAEKSEKEAQVPESPSQESGPLWKENEKFSWEAFYTKLFPDTERYLHQRQLYHELLNDYSPTSQKVQGTVSKMLSAVERLYTLYEKTLQQRQKDLQTLIAEECRSDSPIMISAMDDINKIKHTMSQLQPEHSAQGALICGDVMTWLQPGCRKVLTAEGIVYAFRWCPPGEFIMGSENGNDNEQPVHKVTLTKGFWLLETEVTQAMWRSVMNEIIEFKVNRPKKLGIGNAYPMYCVNWDDSQTFCRKLSQKLGQQVKLPTEAQWEYACRAGTTGDYAGDLDSMAWYGEDWNGITNFHLVAEKKPNAWGLYDMHGNVWEWCSDYYDKEYYSKTPRNDPENTTASSAHVARGGNCGGDAKSCRSASRGRFEPDVRYEGLGFRVVLVPCQDE